MQKALDLIGGIKAIIWTDALQALVFMGGGLAVAVFLFLSIPGSWTENLAAAGEAGKFHTFTWTGSLNNESLSGIFFEWAAAPRKMVVTQAAMANLLVPPLRSLELPAAPDHLKAYGFESCRRTVIVAWAAEGAGPVTVSWTKGTWKAADLLGNELDVTRLAITQRPVYLVSQKTRPERFPW